MKMYLHDLIRDVELNRYTIEYSLDGVIQTPIHVTDKMLSDKEVCQAVLIELLKKFSKPFIRGKDVLENTKVE